MARQLHHLLALERQFRKTAETIFAETRNEFDKGSHYMGETKEYFPDEEDGDPLPRVDKEVVATVPERLKWTWKHLIPLLNLEYQKDDANMSACSSIPGLPVSFAFPATFLLALEKHLLVVREIYCRIPTLDLARKWEHSERDNVFRHGPSKTYRTEKTTVPVVLSPATDKHPANVQPVTKDVTIGHYETTTFSGAVHPKDKARWIGKIDDLLARVKYARMEANKQEVTSEEIGDMLEKFIHAED